MANSELRNQMMRSKKQQAETPGQVSKNMANQLMVNFEEVMRDINTIVNENVTLKSTQGGKDVKAIDARQRIGATLYKTQKEFAGVDAKHFIENPGAIQRKSP